MQYDYQKMTGYLKKKHYFSFNIDKRYDIIYKKERGAYNGCKKNRCGI